MTRPQFSVYPGPAQASRRAFSAPLALGAWLAIAVLLSSCRPPDPASGSAAGAADGLTVTLELAAEAVGPAPATVRVREGSQDVSGATVEVQGDMSHAGMVPVIAEAVESEPGVYRADDFRFTMAGDWFVTATVETPEGKRATQETFLTVRGR